MGILGACGYRDHVSRAYGNAFARDTQRAFALEEHEQLLLRVVEVIGTGCLSWRHDVDARTQLACHGTGNARTNHTTATRLVDRRTLLGVQLDLLDVAYQLRAQLVAPAHLHLV